MYLTHNRRSSTSRYIIIYEFLVRNLHVRCALEHFVVSKIPIEAYSDIACLPCWTHTGMSSLIVLSKGGGHILFNYMEFISRVCNTIMQIEVSRCSIVSSLLQ